MENKNKNQSRLLIKKNNIILMMLKYKYNYINW